MSLTSFSESAARSLEQSPILPGDPQADRRLAEARARIYYWPETFPGFEASLTLRSPQGIAVGSLHAPCSRSYRLDWDPAREAGWMRAQIGELLAHREAPRRSRIVSETGVVFGDDDPVYGPAIHFVGDKMQSFYRVKSGRLTQIGRSYRGQRFLINIDRHVRLDGRWAAAQYTAFYWSLATGALERVETYLDDYVEVDGVHLPARRRYSEATSESLRNLELRFRQHRILEASPCHETF